MYVFTYTGDSPFDTNTDLSSRAANLLEDIQSRITVDASKMGVATQKQTLVDTIQPPAWALLFQRIRNGILIILSFLNFVLVKLFGLTKDGNKDEKSEKKLKSVKEIPGPIPLPIFGTTLTSSALKMSNLLQANEARMQEFGAIVKEEHFWGFPMIHLLDPEDIERAVKVVGNIRPGMEILSYYRNLRPDRYDSIGLTNAQGKDWEKIHSVVNPVLTSPRFITSITQASDEMALDFVDLIKKSGPHYSNVQELVRKFVIETAFYNVLGKRLGFLCSDDDNPPPPQLEAFLEANDRLWAALHETSYGLPWWKYFPTKLWKRNTEAEDHLVDIVEDLIQSAIKDDSTHVGGLLGSMLDSDQVSYKTKRLLILETIMGSSDSVISTVTFMLYWISRDERVANKLFSELQTAFPTKNFEVDGESLNKLPYLKACMMETYRICCIAPNVMRLTEQPLEVGGYLIPPYSLLVLQWGYAAMQEDSFYKPTEFLPERWIYEGNVPPFKPHRRNVMYPFGMGRRACPGSRVVKLHVSILLARIFRNFKVSVEGPMEAKYQWLVQPGHPVAMKFTERIED